MQRILSLAVFALTVLATSEPAISQSKMSAARINDVRVLCDSRGFGRQQCAADLRGFVFRSVRAVPGARCEVGRNFGYDDNAVWVDQGCRGEFFFTYRGDDGFSDGSGDARSDLNVRCESRDGRRATCPAELRGMYFSTLRQISRTECVEGRNWGYDDRALWVEGGCRADFSFVRGRGPGNTLGGTRSPKVVACASPNSRHASCPEDLRGYALTDMRQQSRTQCVLGQNFGYDERGVWVEGGCRAEFEFEYRGPGYRGNAPFGGGGSTGSTSLLTCESVENRRVSCELPRSARIRFVKQLSRAACTEGSTWGFDQRGIWVDRGCRAEFEVIR
jgi:hypothetical protein